MCIYNLPSYYLVCVCVYLFIVYYVSLNYNASFMKADIFYYFVCCYNPRVLKESLPNSRYLLFVEWIWILKKDKLYNMI